MNETSPLRCRCRARSCSCLVSSIDSTAFMPFFSSLLLRIGVQTIINRISFVTLFAHKKENFQIFYHFITCACDVCLCVCLFVCVVEVFCEGEETEERVRERKDRLERRKSIVWLHGRSNSIIKMHTRFGSSHVTIGI